MTCRCAAGATRVLYKSTYLLRRVRRKPTPSPPAFKGLSGAQPCLGQIHVYYFAMSNEAKILIEKAKSLPAADREDILEALLASLQQEPSAQADQAWRDLIDARLAALERGNVETFDFDETVALLRRK